MPANECPNNCWRLLCHRLRGHIRRQGNYEHQFLRRRRWHHYHDGGNDHDDLRQYYDDDHDRLDHHDEFADDYDDHPANHDYHVGLHHYDVGWRHDNEHDAPRHHHDVGWRHDHDDQIRQLRIWRQCDPRRLDRRRFLQPVDGEQQHRLGQRWHIGVHRYGSRRVGSLCGRHRLDRPGLPRRDDLLPAT